MGSDDSMDVREQGWEWGALKVGEPRRSAAEADKRQVGVAEAYTLGAL